MRRLLSALLLLAGSVAAVLAATSVWASRALLDESGWETRAAAVADDPAVATAIADEVIVRIPVTLDDAQEGRVRAGVAAALRAPTVQEAWARLNREAAKALLAVARGEGDRYLNENGDVVLDPEPLLQSLVDTGGPLAELLAQREAREIVLVEAGRLDPLRTVTDVGDAAPPILIAAAVLLLGLGALAAPGALFAVTGAFLFLLAACAGVLAAFLAARDQALERARPGLADSIVASTFATAERPLAITVGGGALVALGLVAVIAGLRSRSRRPADESD